VHPPFAFPRPHFYHPRTEMSPLPPLLYLPSALTLLISYTIHRSRHLYTQAQTPPLPPYYTFPIHSQWHVNIQAIALIFIPCTYIPEKQYIEIVTWTSVLVLAYVNAGKWGRWKRWVVVQWVVGTLRSQSDHLARRCGDAIMTSIRN